MDKIKQIGFKAGEKPKRPVIQEDTSASKSYASIAYGISEGEIVGLIDGAKSVYLDGTPVMSVSGDINIPDVTIQERQGTNDQTHLEGFPAVVNEKQYNNIEMLQTTPFVHYINDTNLDAVGIRFTFGALQKTNPDNGNVSGITIEYAIDAQTDGQGYQELLRTSIVGKYSAGYQRYHRVELPPAEEGWEVRIRRITPNSTSTYITDKMYLDAVAEILDVKMRYPNTALIGLKFDSERFSNIPKVDFRMRGKIIRVPANYDPVARTYAQSGEGTTNGIWNGQFKMAYTTNPAWIFYDLVLNKRYGLGNRIDPSMLDKWSLYSIAQYCDVMVPDGEGGLEPRFTCNVYINNRFEAYDCLLQLAGVFRGIMYWSGTAIIAGCDRPQDPVFTYTRANIIGEFNYSGTRTRDRHSVVMVSFDDPKNNYKTEKEIVSDRKAISEIGIRTKDLAAFACTSRGQAQRAGKWALFKEQLETRIVTFALGMDGYIAPVGRVIEIADPLLAGRAVGGRIAAVSVDKKTITLDRDTEVKVGDRLVLNNEEGEQESRQVTSVTGRNVTVSVAFDSPAVQHVWAIDSDDLQLMRFTVISVVENRSQDSINFTVTALQHEPDLHEAADYSAHIDRNTYSVIDITTQKAPAEVLISSVNRINQGIDITDLVISWKQAENAVKYHVQWRRDDGNWIQLPLQYGNQVTIENIYHGVYEAKVVAINAADVNSLPTSSLPTTINSKFAAPAALASLSATGILLGVELNWKFPLYGAQNAAYVEIYWALNADKSDEKLLGSYAYPTTETTLNGLAPHLTLYFRGRLVDRNGIASEFTQWVTATVDANPDKLIDIISGHISESTLDQVLQGKIDSASNLANDAQNLANQAKTAADQAAIKAQEAANAVVQEATDRASALTTQANTLKADSAAKVQALKDEVDPKITALQNGITQVTTDYKAADTQVVGQLNAYKTSNDNAVASVLQKAESAVSTGSTNSSAITAINGQITALNGALGTKLDASVISGYYTKGQTDAKAAEIAAGKVEEFNANLKIGGRNLWNPSETISAYESSGSYTYSNDAHRFLPTYLEVSGSKLLLQIWNPNKVINTTYSNRVAFYTEDKTHINSSVLNLLSGESYQKQEFNIPANAKYMRLSVISGASTYDPSIKFKFELGTVYTEWTASEEEVANSINANSTAIQNTNAEVSRVDGRVTAANSAITSLSGRVSNVEGAVSTKAEATALNALTTRVSNAEGVNTSQGTAITTLQNTVNNETTGLATKASTSALTATNSEVARVNGVVTGHTNQLTQLTSDITAINGTLATKLDSSAIVNYYTKQQADDKALSTAAGEISKYDANLVIGGTNLFSIADSIAGYTEYGTGSIIKSTPSHLAMQTLIPIGKHKQLVYQVWNPSLILNAVNTNRLVFFKADGSFLSLYDVPQLDGTPYQKSLITVPDTAAYVRLAAIVGQYNAARDTNLKVKFEFGNKPTDWTPSDGDVQSSLNANANAIQTVNTEVSRINGEVVSTANSVSTLSSNVGLLQGSINEVRQTVTNNQESTNTLVTSLRSGMADADDVSMMMRNATVLHEDLSFKNGWNGVQVYNNHGNGALVANFTDKLPDNPVASTRQLQFIHSGGATTPELGGFHQVTYSRANGVFLVKFVAKLPVGFSFGLGSNPYGDGATCYFIGGNEGTGKFKTYYGVYRCGATGSFSTISFVYVRGQWPTPENPLIWYLASSTVYDCLDSKVAPDSVVNGIAEAKSIASTAVNKSEATALIAQNLQASLDNTNANLSNNYYTKSSTNEAISNQITNLSATLDMNTLPSKRDTTKANQWLLTHVVPKNAGWVSQGVKPDFSTLKTGIKNKRIYCADGNTMFSSSEYDNTVLYFRTIVYVHTDVEVNLGNFIGDDAHSIYVNGVLNFTKGYYGSTANLILALKAGLNTVDVICYNSGGGAGFSSSVSLSSLVVNMYAPESVEEQAAATANAVSSLTTTVSNIDGRVSSQASQIVTLESSKSAIENGGIAGNNEYIVDLRHPAYNRDLYYPVLLGGFSTEFRQIIRVMSTLNGLAIPPWASHGNGYSLNAQFQMGGAGWGTVDPEVITDNFSYLWTHGGISPLDQIGQIWESSQPFFYVRGGGYYRLSKPVNRSVQVCAPNGSLSGYNGGTLNPRPYQASTVPKSINQGLNQQNVKLQQTNTVLDGVKAVSTVTVDNNGVMSGYGLISELVNGRVTSAFGVNANTFYIGSPSLNKKPFVQRNDWSVINGVSVPPGTYIDTAYIGAATIGNAHINDLAVSTGKIDNAAITTAKIGDGQITAAKIGDLQVDTLKIKDNAVTVPVYSYAADVANMPKQVWTTCQSIWSPCSQGSTLFFFNFVYDCRRQDTKYSILCRILKDGKIVKNEFRVLFFEANAGSVNIAARPIGTIALNYTDTTLVDGNFELQLYVDAGNSLDVSNRYSTSLTVRK